MFATVQSLPRSSLVRFPSQRLQGRRARGCQSFPLAGSAIAIVPNNLADELLSSAAMLFAVASRRENIHLRSAWKRSGFYLSHPVCLGSNLLLTEVRGDCLPPPAPKRKNTAASDLSQTQVSLCSSPGRERPEVHTAAVPESASTQINKKERGLDVLGTAGENYGSRL